MARTPSKPTLPSKRAILDFLSEADGDASRRDIARAFGLKNEHRAALRSLLKDMEAEGLLSGKRRRVHAPGELPPVLPIDVMSVDEDGDLVCMPAKWRDEVGPPMIRIRAKEAAKQKPLLGVGDRVLARLAAAGDDGYQATVIKPIGQSAHRFLAVFRERKFGGVAEPVERRVRQKFTIDRGDTRGAKDGDLVWVEASPRRGRTSTTARVREIAGHIDDSNAYSTMALANHGVPTDMPDAAVREAEKAKEPSPEGREDLRNLPLLTIDPADAKDHDDAIWAAPDDDPENEGGHQIIVAIADVSWFVRAGSALDREARRRGNSVYLPDRVIPMLPERLSNGLCSLRVGEDRPCLAVEMTIDRDGRMRGHRFTRAIMRSAAKLSYEEAQDLIDNPRPGVAGETVDRLKAAFDARMRERAKRAPLDLDLPERKITLNKDGTVASVDRRERFDAHRIVEELMILANIAAAETLERRRTLQIYRVHEPPDEEKLASTREYLETLDYSLTRGGAIRPRNFNQLLAIAAGRGQKELISELVLRSQTQAYYGVENAGHFGLNLPRYSHFTSPIRRYADLTIHRALVSACKLGEGGQAVDEAEALADIAERISDTERRAMAAEREAKDRYLASYLEERVGDSFEGKIRGVTRFGLFVALNDTGADGFVPMRAVGFERFRFEEAEHALIGETTGGVYRLGQVVTVRLAEATPLSGGLRFELLSDPLTIAPAKKAARRKSAKKPTGRKQNAKPRKAASAPSRSASKKDKTSAAGEKSKPAKRKPKRANGKSRRA